MTPSELFRFMIYSTKPVSAERAAEAGRLGRPAFDAVVALLRGDTLTALQKRRALRFLVALVKHECVDEREALFEEFERHACDEDPELRGYAVNGVMGMFHVLDRLALALMERATRVVRQAIDKGLDEGRRRQAEGFVADPHMRQLLEWVDEA